MSMGNGGREIYGRVTVRYKIHFIEVICLDIFCGNRQILRILQSICSDRGYLFFILNDYPYIVR